MFTPPKYIWEHCPECNPARTRIESICRFIGEICEEAEESLYACCDCGAKIWVPTHWAKCHQIENGIQSKTVLARVVQFPPKEIEGRVSSF